MSVNLQRFYLVVNVCKTTPVESLVGTISKRRISKASVLHERKRSVVSQLWFTGLRLTFLCSYEESA